MRNYEVIKNLEFPLSDIMDEVTKEILRLKSEGDEELATMYEELQKSLDNAQGRMVDIQIKLAKRTIAKLSTN